MTITEFLEARIAEDEAAAKFRRQGDKFFDDERTLRMSAECAAKRRILSFYPGAMGAVKIDDWESCGDSCAEWVAVCSVQALAAVYADHPDYRQEWAL